jgi:cellulose synthase/poly-beta-1,6-N-acetylglucosamine synthase-like glycosyltransferase
VSSDSIRLSIIVPVHNGAHDLRDCLTALIDECGPDAEIIVVDDASTDETPSVAARLGTRVLQLSKNSGPAVARNHGADHARGDVLFFVDADVIIAPGAVDRVRKVFAEDSTVAAVFGSYDATPRAHGVVSRYRNLLHHFVHQNGPAEASTFWTGCGAIRRTVFHRIGGFNPRSVIEDIELGHRLHRAGHRILLDKTLQGTHLKRWNLRSMVHTDVTRRAIPWARLTLESKELPATLNLTWDQRLSALLVAVAGASLLAVGYRPELAAVTVTALAAVLVLNRKLYSFFFQRGGLPFTVACIALHLLYYVYSGLSYLFAWLEYRVAGRPAIGQR